jgi:hypothetical protein
MPTCQHSAIGSSKTASWGGSTFWSPPAEADSAGDGEGGARRRPRLVQPA